MSWLLYLVAVLIFLGVFRTRSRIRSMAVLPIAGEPVRQDAAFFSAEGVTLDDTTKAAATSYAAAHGIELLDIIPQNASVLEVLRFLERIDPKAYRANRIGLGYSCGYALMASGPLVTQSQNEAGASSSIFARARALKRYAINCVDIAIAPSFKAPSPKTGLLTWTGLFQMFGPGAQTALVINIFVLLFLIAGVFFAPLPGLVAIAVYHLQPLLIFAGLPLRPRDLAIMILFRTPLECWNVIHLIYDRMAGPNPDSLKVDELRATYATRLAGGLKPFFEDRREDCPFCSSRDIRVHIRTTDLFQYKPGRFTLERCADCGHVFQNPRLTFAGLDFYYADFYDGLNATQMERIFSVQNKVYDHRVSAIRGFGEPGRWLDVGAAHGHFCCYAKGLMPKTSFDGLEMSAAIDDAVRCRWVDQGYRGIFPEIAPQLASQYDVVSSFHCLEHVPDPPAEIKAAYTTLVPGGLLFIEVPNPECLFGRIFGRFWMAWLQPQHLNMYSSTNLSELLRQHGFELLHFEGSSSEEQSDILMATIVFLTSLAPPIDLPWQGKPTLLDRLRFFARLFGFPLLVLAFIADHVLAPLVSRFKIHAAYRIVARKVVKSDGPAQILQQEAIPVAVESQLSSQYAKV